MNIHFVEKNVLLTYRNYHLAFFPFSDLTLLSSFLRSFAHLTLCLVTPNSWTVLLILQLLGASVSILIYSFPETSFNFSFTSSTGLSRSLQLVKFLFALVLHRFAGVISNASANFLVNSFFVCLALFCP